MLLILYFHSAFILVTKILFNLLELFNGFNVLLSVRISTLSLGSVVGGTYVIVGTPHVIPVKYVLSILTLLLVVVVIIIIIINIITIIITIYLQ